MTPKERIWTAWNLFIRYEYHFFVTFWSAHLSLAFSNTNHRIAGYS